MTPFLVRIVLVIRRRSKFRNAHAHASRTVWDIVRWKLGLQQSRRKSTIAGTIKLPAPTARPPRAVPSIQNLSSSNPLDVAPAIAESAIEPIRLTWLGHSTFLIQIDGRNILTDPIFGDCRPLPYGRFRRVTPPGLRIDQLPPIHDVLISHSHYDHLDLPTIRALGSRVHYWVPKGLKAWFRKRGFRSCSELAWWTSAPLSHELTLHCVPAQHGSARSLFDRNRTHWCGWVLKSEHRSIYFAGDTGYCPIFSEIGNRLGGFDLAMIPIGAYEPRWLMQTVHLNPAEAVQVHLDLGSKLSVACHWGTFHLTDEDLREPPLILEKECRAHGLGAKEFIVVKPGVTLEI